MVEIFRSCSRFIIVGAQFGSITAALLCGFLVWAVSLRLVWAEEARRIALHEDYRGYMARVLHFLPAFALWRSPAIIAVRPRNVLVTFLDGLVFPAAVPLSESFEYLHGSMRYLAVRVAAEAGVLRRACSPASRSGF